ncbi:response regulator [Phycisphaera mikurensis]|uniref:Putative two-component system response regulator n=1 Tax=Phycisphaera mikurensis (strain NBRC 102666 / KCTC 22515 / FYK2301M01) TaxID=1142394 RepID=I0IGM9_PHYMF|nr:response regulator [Phycisphaera mikurensis]MBB6442901.1 excisionase family DNA binding protein [Phycisphaera mikurensis]BAM04417.1 putative two-component system response regulator [Phycisphaera mikurensis NBRC 102666]
MSNTPTRKKQPAVDGRRPLGGLAVFTTGEAATATGLSQQTIIRNFDAGRLQGYRVPGSRFRRIPRDSLLAFLKDNGIPLDRLREGSRHRLLVVDDDPGVLALLDEVLRLDGRFEVRTATCGYDAGMESVGFRPELILLDYMLPDINGDRVCRSVKETPELSDTRVLIISGAATDEEVERLMAAGADGFLQKPFELTTLIARIEALLDLPAAV